MSTNDSVLAAAASAHASAEADRNRTALASFKTLLKEKFQIDTDPTDLTAVVGGVIIRYLNPKEISVVRKCPDCTFTCPTDGVRDLEHLGRELAARPIPGHDCKKRRKA